MVQQSPVNIVLALLSITVGGLSTVAGLLILIYGATYIKSVIIALYYIIFGLWIIALEIFWPVFLLSWVGFYSRWLGKGLFFIFLGFLIVDNTGYWLAAGIIIIVVGAIYVILHFVKVGSPRPLRDTGEHHHSSTTTTTTTTSRA